MDLDDPIALALAIAEALRGQEVPHALYGGLLLAAYGEARETRDRDLADAESVTRSLGADLQRELVELEVRSLAGASPEHDITARWRRVLASQT